MASIRYRVRQHISSKYKEHTLLFKQSADQLEPSAILLDTAIRNIPEESARRFKPQYLMGVFHWYALVHVAITLRAAFTERRLNSYNLE